VWHFRAGLQHPLGLGDRLVDVYQRNHRGGEDAPVAVEPPVVLEPAIEGREVCVEDVNVVVQFVFHRDTEAGKEQRGVQALLVEQCHPGISFHHRRKVVGADHLGLAPTFGVLAFVNAEEGAGTTPGCTRVVALHDADQSGRLIAVVQPPESVLLAGADVDRAVLELRLDVAGERVVRLVVVTVGVDRTMSQLVKLQGQIHVRVPSRDV
jgi:hypothetical protein